MRNGTQARRGAESITCACAMAVRERKFFVGGNWKMNGSKSSIDSIVEFLVKGPLSADSGRTAHVCPCVPPVCTYVHAVSPEPPL